MPLGLVRQSGGKQVTVWAVEGDLDPATAVSNTVELEWPPRSGVFRSYPEVDRVAWFGADAAREKLVRAQAAFVDRLLEVLRT
jgi:predicted NUDIX family NTP pyrophosphohydrolase